MENENTIKRSCSYSCSSEESDERPPFSQGLDYESSGADISGEGEGCSSSSSSSLTFSRGGTRRADVASSSDGWPESSSSAASATPFAFAGGRDTVIWEETKDRLNSQLSAMDMMKERFSKLLLGEDMSGCGKGVCSALAISNAITNLAASVFGEVWRLEPLSPARKSTWRREMEWMLSVTDSIVELIPTWQQDAEGSCLEVMISRPRSDLYINLPALKKLDAMLLEIFDSFTDTEFWYVDGGILLEDINSDASDPPRRLMQHQQDKWWLPVPRVPKTGLSECSRKQLQHHRECTGQILKAAVSINSTILSEMEVPSGYLDSLPKTGRDCLGDIIYRYITAEQFSPECLLDCLDLSSEHHILDIANRIEAAIHVWKQKAASTHINKGKPNRTRAKSSWRKVRILVGGFERRALLLERAESLLLTLKLRFPGLSQTVLDMNKIQDNKDVGYSILESYSRVLESLAFNIIARIDDLIYADDIAKNDLQNKLSALSMVSTHLSKDNMPSSSTHATPFATPSFSPAFIASPGRASDSVFNCNKYSTQINSQSKRLTDFLGARNADSNRRPDEISRIRKSVLAELGKAWSYAENIENRKFFFKSSSP